MMVTSQDLKLLLTVPFSSQRERETIDTFSMKQMAVKDLCETIKA